MQQVPEPGSPTPLPRIGDAERDAAAARLQTAMAEGRLTPQEFDERLDVALRARTQADLAPLFADLPAPGSNPQAVAVPAASGATAVTPTGDADQPSRGRQPWAGLYGALWPLTLLVCFATDWRFWWLIFVPIVLGPIIFNRSRTAGGQRALERQQQRDQRRAEIRDAHHEQRMARLEGRAQRRQDALRARQDRHQP